MTKPTRTKSIFWTVLSLALLTTAPTAWAQSPPADARFYTSAEYLMWWIKDAPAPPTLLSTGEFGTPAFSTILGGRSYDPGPQPGGRFTAGYQLSKAWAVEGTGFFLTTSSVTKTVASSGEPGSTQLVIPQFRIDEGSEGTFALARPGDFAGDARESFRSAMSGAELNVVRRLTMGPGWRLDAIGGFRYLRLNEQLAFSGSSVSLALPDIFMATDTFATDNRFYGGQFGVKADYTWRGWFAQASAKVALGVMRESLDVAGSLSTNDFNATPFVGGAQSFVGGFFAQPSNIGRFRRDRFAVVPEGIVKIGYQLAPWASVFVGYTFLYASEVARPGDQLERVVNTTASMTYQVPSVPPPTLTPTGPARPEPRFRGTDVWVQGVTAGVAFSF